MVITENGVHKEEVRVHGPCIHRIIGADLSFVTVGLSFTVAKGFSPLKRNAQSYRKDCCKPKSKPHSCFIQVV